MDPQRRADRIRAFRDELAELERAIGPVFEPEAGSRVLAWHDQLLAELKAGFDVDTGEAERQLSLGMRLASLLGAAALCGAVFFFFYRFWGLVVTPAQVGLVTSGPILGVALAEFAAHREKTLYFASLAAVVSFAAFILALSVVGAIYNLTPSPGAFLAWGAFALILAYAYDVAVLLVAGIVCVTVFALGSVMGLFQWWVQFLVHWEGHLLAGCLWFVTPLIWKRQPPRFAIIYRVSGAVLAFSALMVLGANADFSVLPFDQKVVERFYDVLGLAAAGGGIVLGIRRQWADVRLVSTGALILLMYVKAFDWWWSWMPRWIFFLVLGGMAVAVLVLLRMLRARRAAA